jgi:hypothetical protein
VVLVDGKVDAQGGDPKVLVDSVTTDLKSFTSNVPPPSPTSVSAGSNPPAYKGRPDSFSSPTQKSSRKASQQVEESAAPPEDWGDTPEPPENGGPVSRAPTPAPRGKASIAGAKPSRRANPDSGPIPPENFDSDWTAMEITPGGFVVERGVISAEAPMPMENGSELSTVSSEPPVEEQTGLRLAVNSEPSRSSGETLDISTETLPTFEIEQVNNTVTVGVGLAASLEPVESPPASEATILGAEVPHMETTTTPPYILPPTEAYAGQELHMITVILRPGVDKVRDNLRLRQCYGILISYSGHDRFALQIFERSRGYRIEFPNYTTTFCTELVNRLASIVGADNVIVEALRLH